MLHSGKLLSNWEFLDQAGEFGKEQNTIDFILPVFVTD
jgi:hypothetical protein